MFDIGFWELFLILILALLVVGPERLPKAARTAGYWFGKARRYVEGARDELANEFDVGELKRMIHNQEVQINELQNQLNHPIGFDDVNVVRNILKITTYSSAIPECLRLADMIGGSFKNFII